MKKEIEKIVINTGLKEEMQDAKKREQLEKSLSLISGQKPIATQARQSIASFGIREGQEIGYKVTLRGKRKENFFEKLVKIALPRMKDFSGIDPESFDEHGNLTLGFPDVKVFPELSEKHDLLDFGLEITIVTPQDERRQAIKFLKEKGMPLIEADKRG